MCTPSTSVGGVCEAGARRSQLNCPTTSCKNGYSIYFYAIIVNAMVSDYLTRHIDARLASAVQATPIVILDGPRAVGKTTTALRLAGSVVRLPQDLGRLDVLAADTLAALEPPVLIDEWQLAGPDLLWTLKQIVDQDSTPGRFLLTGSVEPATYGPTYPLTGRAVRLVMWPMTSAELAGRGSESTWLHDVSESGPPRPTIGTSGGFEIGRLAVTGFPAARLQHDPSMFLEGYAALVSQRAGEEGRDASRLMRALRVLAVLEAQAVPDQTIWDAADLNKATWKAYDDLLQRTYLSDSLPSFESNRLKRLTRYPKRFLADTALAMTLANVGVDDMLADRDLAGRYLESFVAQQLRPQVPLLGGRLSHLRTSAGQREVDFVIEVGDRLYGLEVKASQRVDRSDAKHLLWMRDELGDRFKAGFVLHTGGDVFPLDDEVWALPISALVRRACEVLTHCADAGALQPRRDERSGGSGRGCGGRDRP